MMETKQRESLQDTDTRHEGRRPGVLSIPRSLPGQRADAATTRGPLARGEGPSKGCQLL